MTGDELARLVASPPPPPLALIDALLYEHTCFLLTGATGQGKSVLAAQMALSLASGTPCFSALAVAQPVRVYYMQLEGSIGEQLRRLHAMQPVVPLNASNLYWDADRITLPITRFDRIASAFSQPPQVVIIDPIYKLTGGDLAKADQALLAVRFSDRLMTQLDCTVILVHHPHRTRFTLFGKKIEEDDAYYGHSFLKNHVEVSYVFKPLDDAGQRGRLICLKRREENVLSRLDLTYHPETYTCSMLPIQSTESTANLVEQALAACAAARQTTTFYDVQAKTGVSTVFLRKLQARFVSEGRLDVLPQPGERSVWVPKNFPSS